MTTQQKVDKMRGQAKNLRREAKKYRALDTVDAVEYAEELEYEAKLIADSATRLLNRSVLDAIIG